MRPRRPWQITKVELTSEAKRFGWAKVQYPFHVEGFNHNTRPASRISWSVPSLDDPQFDLDSAEVSAEAMKACGWDAAAETKVEFTTET